MLGRIGGGAYGEVFLAQTVTGLHRAVKVVRREDFEMERTFEREFEGIQKYEKVSKKHPGLVDVLHVGRDDEAGFYYYVMELADDVDGHHEEVDPESYKPRTLSSDLKMRPSRSISDCVDLGVSLAEALGHLHEEGVTHRDVKPSNIIFVDGMPKLADVGLVAASGQRTYVGTEGYVPPEGPGTPSADLYSLAMVLYEMHTGKDRLDFPELPTNLEIAPTVNRDEWRSLNSAICRAGSPDPAKRYDTAYAFAAALRRITSKGVPATELQPGSSVGKIAWISLAVVGVTLIVAGGVLLWNDRQDFIGAHKENPLLVGNKGKAKGKEKGETGGKGGKEKGGNGDFSLIPFEKVEDGEVKFTDPKIVIKDPEPDPDPDPPKEKEPKIVATVVEPPKESALLKISSTPGNATVWKNGEEIGRTTTPFLAFEPGPVELQLKLQGYHDYQLSQILKEGRQSAHATLVQDLRPVPGAPWVNSLGILFSRNETGDLITEVPLTTEPLERFAKETGTPVSLVAMSGAAQVAEDRMRWDLCDWMTALDREKGYLDETQYHVPLRGSGPAGENAVYSRLDSQFGALIVNSIPEGADVFRGSKLIGRTPLVLEKVRFGPFQLDFRLGGHRMHSEIGAVLAAEAQPLVVELEADDSVVFDGPWVNSLGQRLVPVIGLMAAAHETRVQDFQTFLTESGAAIFPPRPGYPQGPDHPVAGVSASDAELFCEWLTRREQDLELIQPTQRYRLPTDREWSRMAGLENEEGASPEERDRPTAGRFPWGKEWPPPANAGNFSDTAAEPILGKYTISQYTDGFARTSPVGSFLPTESGIHDLSGNVWEWVSDYYNDSGSRLRVLRGGGWKTYEQEVLLSSYRNPVPEGTREGVHGFRVVLVDEAVQEETPVENGN